MLFLGATLAGKLTKVNTLELCAFWELPPPLNIYDIYIIQYLCHILVKSWSPCLNHKVYPIPDRMAPPASQATTPRLGEHSPRSRHRSDASRSHRPNRSERETCSVKTSCRFMPLVTCLLSFLRFLFCEKLRMHQNIEKQVTTI